MIATSQCQESTLEQRPGRRTWASGPQVAVHHSRLQLVPCAHARKAPRSLRLPSHLPSHLHSHHQPYAPPSPWHHRRCAVCLSVCKRAAVRCHSPLHAPRSSPSVCGPLSRAERASVCGEAAAQRRSQSFSLPGEPPFRAPPAREPPLSCLHAHCAVVAAVPLPLNAAVPARPNWVARAWRHAMAVE